MDGMISDCVEAEIYLHARYPTTITLHVVPNLTTQLILGRDFFRSHSVQLNLADNILSFTLPTQHTIHSILQKPLLLPLISPKLTQSHSTTNNTQILQPADISTNPTEPEMSEQNRQGSTPNKVHDKLQSTNSASNTTPDSQCKVPTNYSYTPEKPAATPSTNIPRDWSHALRPQLVGEQLHAFQAVLTKNKDAFIQHENHIGACSLPPLKVRMKANATPTYTPQFKISPKLQPKLDATLQSYLDQGVIEPATSPWNSPLHAVFKQVKRSHKHTSQKKDKVRIVLDLRKVNEQIEPTLRNIPNISSIIDDMLTPYHNNTKPKYFSSIDVSNMYYQIALHPDSRDMTAFQWKNNTYRFTRLAQGMKVSAGYSTLIMQQILGHLKHKPIYHYIDDVIITSSTLEEHLQLIDDVLQAFAKHRLLISPSKCKFAAKQIEFLGYNFTADEYSPSTKHIKALQTYPVPQTAKQLRTFLGLCCFFRAFIPNRAKLCAPLYKLTKRSAKFVWSAECQKSFDKLIKILTQPPVLQLPRFDEPFHLFTDCSTISLAGVLCQKQDGKFHPVGFCARSLTNSEKNYPITKMELLAVTYAIQHWRHYLQANKFHLYTDHKALKTLFSMKKLSPQLTRFGLLLQAYDFDITHVRGLLNGAPDALSRVRYLFKHSPTDDYIQSYPQHPPIQGNPKQDKLFAPSEDTVEHCLYTLKRETEIRRHRCTLIGKEDLTEPLQALFNNETKQEITGLHQNPLKNKQISLSQQEPDTCTQPPDKGSLLVSNSSDILVSHQTPSQANTSIPDHHPYNLRQTSDRKVKAREQQIEENKTLKFHPAAPPKSKFKENQRLDPLTLAIYNFHTYATNPKDKHIARKLSKYRHRTKVIDDIVMIRSSNKNPHLPQTYLTFVPSMLQPKVLASLHNDTSSAHLGVTRTIHLAQQYYYWPNLTKDIKTFIGSCNKCLSTKRSQHRLNPPLETFDIPTGPNQRLHCDLLGPLPLSINKFQYVAVIIDAFSKLVVTFPMRTKSSQEFLKGFHHKYICTYGVPHSIYTDNGGEFKNTIMKDLCHAYNITHNTCSGYTPKANGLAERSVQTVTNLLRSSISNNYRDWDVILPHITFHINATISTATGYSPFFITFGRYPNLHLPIPQAPKNYNTTFISDLVERLSRLHADISRTLKTHQQKYKSRYDRHTNSPSYAVGDIVFMYKPTIDPAHKLTPFYDGPYVITTKLQRNKVSLRNLHTMHPLPEPVHISRLKLSKHYQANI